MYMFSVLDLYSIGVGPSSSHTVGPMLATQRFAKALVQHDVIDEVDRVRVTLYGSLALTGLGHGTDRASVAGLEGNDPQTVDTEYLADVHRICDERGTIRLAGVKTITFDYNHDMVIDVWHRLAAHPNGMRCEAFDAQGRPVYEQVWYSVGAGSSNPDSSPTPWSRCATGRSKRRKTPSAWLPVKPTPRCRPTAGRIRSPPRSSSSAYARSKA